MLQWEKLLLLRIILHSNWYKNGRKNPKHCIQLKIGIFALSLFGESTLRTAYECMLYSTCTFNRLQQQCYYVYYEIYLTSSVVCTIHFVYSLIIISKNPSIERSYYFPLYFWGYIAGATIAEYHAIWIKIYYRTNSFIMGNYPHNYFSIHLWPSLY